MDGPYPDVPSLLKVVSFVLTLGVDRSGRSVLVSRVIVSLLMKGLVRYRLWRFSRCVSGTVRCVTLPCDLIRFLSGLMVVAFRTLCVDCCLLLGSAS